MRIVGNDSSSVGTLAKLQEVQREIRNICEPHYDEFHKVTNDHGFIKITIPRRRA